MACQNGGRNPTPLTPPVLEFPMNTTMTTAARVPIGPMRLCKVAASSATAKAMNVETALGTPDDRRAGDDADRWPVRARVPQTVPDTRQS